MAYYVCGPDGKRVLKPTKKDNPAAQLAEIEARAKVNTGGGRAKVADGRKFNGPRKVKRPKRRAGHQKNPQQPPKQDLLAYEASKLTPELREDFKKWILIGMTQEKACWQVGITPDTLRIWQARAKDPKETDPKYREFIAGIQKAEGTLFVKLTAGFVRQDGNAKKFMESGGQFDFASQRDGLSAAMALRPKDFGNRGAGIAVDKETGALTVGVGTTLSETADMSTEEYETHVELLIRSAKRAKGRGGLRKESEGLKEPRIGHQVTKAGM